MKLVELNGRSTNPGDISWAPIEALAELTVYEDTAPEERISHIGDADGVLTDITGIDRETMEACPNMKFILKVATGYDNIDLDAAKEFGIKVFNIPAYSTTAVAQHTMALMLEAACSLRKNHEAVYSGKWESSDYYNYEPAILLEGKELGIIGYGNIGKKVAALAEAFGMKVNIYSKDRDACISSDVISIHCPLAENTYHLVDEDFISRMKDGAILINTARGKIVDEKALAKALYSGKIRAAGLDCLEQEPPEGSPLLTAPNCSITPHIAFAPAETRQHLVDLAAEVIEKYINGTEINRII